MFRWQYEYYCKQRGQYISSPRAAAVATLLPSRPLHSPSTPGTQPRIAASSCPCERDALCFQFFLSQTSIICAAGAPAAHLLIFYFFRPRFLYFFPPLIFVERCTRGIFLLIYDGEARRRFGPQIRIFDPFFNIVIVLLYLAFGTVCSLSLPSRNNIMQRTGQLKGATALCMAQLQWATTACVRYAAASSGRYPTQNIWMLIIYVSTLFVILLHDNMSRAVLGCVMIIFLSIDPFVS